MHELGIIEQIVQIAEEEVEKADVQGTVTKLTLRVGKLSGASPEALNTAFEIIAPNTTHLRGAVLLIEEPSAISLCHSCGAETEVGGFVIECPACGSPDITITGGRDLQLASIDVDDDTA